MVVKYIPVGTWKYDPELKELNSPQGCCVEDGYDFYVNSDCLYKRVIVQNGVRNVPFFVHISNNSPKKNEGLEKIVSTNSFGKFESENPSIRLEKWQEILPIFYMLGAGLLASFVLVNLWKN